MRLTYDLDHHQYSWFLDDPWFSLDSSLAHPRKKQNFESFSTKSCLNFGTCIGKNREMGSLSVKVRREWWIQRSNVTMICSITVLVYVLQSPLNFWTILEGSVPTIIFFSWTLLKVKSWYTSLKLIKGAVELLWPHGMSKLSKLVK